MCGIGGIFMPAGELFPVTPVQELWTLLEDRGTHAAGICYRWTDSDNDIVKKAAKPASELSTIVENCVGMNTTYAFFHTRYTTQGSTEYNGNNHPVVSQDIILTHNGVIQDKPVFRALKVNPIHQVDTEALNAALRHRSTSWLADNVGGSVSIAWVDITQNQECVNLFTNGGNPLVISRLTNGAIVWASTLQHIEVAGFDIDYSFNAEPFKHYKLYRNEQGYVVVASERVSDQYREPRVATMYRHTASYASDVGYTNNRDSKSQQYAGMYYDSKLQVWKIAKNRRV
tara:strand:- start:249 stop:1106 length:858 start_codon:yes stop_codon:yes gene_type:complete